MVKNKKGLIRIIEAVLAIMIVLSAVLIILSRQQPGYDVGKDVYDRQRQILEVISKNDTLRASILTGDNTQINDFISRLVPPTWNFTTNICNVDQICNMNTPLDREVYVAETIVTATTQTYSPKKVRFFVWGK